MKFLIDRINQIISLSQEEAQLIKQLFTEKRLKKGEHFLREGQVCHSVAMISAGLVRYYINEDGNEGTYYFSREGDFVCDYESFLPLGPKDLAFRLPLPNRLWLMAGSKASGIYFRAWWCSCS